MPTVHLDSRLSLCAAFVRPGHRLADIGTDHAYLPAHLVGTGVCPSAIAADIRPGPLSRAAATVERTGLTGRIDLRLGDGLSPVRPEETDDIVIAGMGGETIAAILAAALQPMSRPEELRRFLLRSGFAIESERIARDGDRLYTVLCAAFSPASAAEQLARPACFYRGGVDAADPDGRAYLFHQAKRLEAAAIALQGAGQADKAESLLKVAGQLTAGLPSKY